VANNCSDLIASFWIYLWWWAEADRKEDLQPLWGRIPWSKCMSTIMMAFGMQISLGHEPFSCLCFLILKFVIQACVDKCSCCRLHPTSKFCQIDFLPALLLLGGMPMLCCQGNQLNHCLTGWLLTVVYYLTCCSPNVHLKVL